jgi:RNA-directed DNA polymerase
MPDASTSESMSPGLLRVATRARREPQGQFHSLAHLIDVDALRRAYAGQRRQAAAGIDGVTKEEYGQDLESNLQDLHQRLRTMRWRHQPLRRVHIPKEGKPGRTRPIGISCFEDKLVQGALGEVLAAVYEQDFRDCSYGFRRGRSAHDALRALNRVCMRGEVNWVLEADIEAFFDSVSWTQLRAVLHQRIPDGSITRLVGKCMHAGVLDGAEFTPPECGTPQGSALSPVLGNLFLHYALDRWFEDEIRPRLRGTATLIRYADDFVIGFERQDDAQRVEAVLARRMARYGLRLQADKTRLIPFARPSRDQTSGKGPGSFDLLGFTCYWRRARTGCWVLAYKTKRGRRQRAMQAVYEWCRRHRHRPVAEQHAGLCARLRGHYNYFGVNGNVGCLAQLAAHARRAWHKWLNRRSQRSRLTWERFEDLCLDYPLPRPRCVVSVWRG